MRKLVTGFAATVLLGSGLAAVGATTGSAAAGPYTGTVATSVRIQGPGQVTKGQRATFCVRVVPVGSDTKPKGRVSVRLTKGKVSQTRTKRYVGKRTCVTTRKLQRRGAHTVRVAYTAKSLSIWKSSRGSTSLRVVAAR